MKLWDLATGQEKASLLGHTDLVLALAYSPDGTMLASAGFGGAIKLWDVGPEVVLPTLSISDVAVKRIKLLAAQTRERSHAQTVTDTP